jgi:conjugative transfer ATPase
VAESRVKASVLSVFKSRTKTEPSKTGQELDEIVVAEPNRGTRRRGTSRRVNQQLYRPDRSFVDLLPWVEALEGESAILLEDGRSVGAVYEVQARGTEGRPESFLAEVRDGLAEALGDVFDEYDNAPWVLQTFTYDELDLSSFMQDVETYVAPKLRETQYTQAYMDVMRKHYAGVCRPEGLFEDRVVTHEMWSGRKQRTLVVIYRRYPPNWRPPEYEAEITPLEALNEVCDKFFNAVGPLGVQHRRLSGNDFHRWMTRWFNAYTDQSPKDPVAFSSSLEEADLPFGDAFSESMLFCHPRSDHYENAWYFDQTASRCLTVEGIRKRPRIGHTTAENRTGDAIHTMMDQMPEGTVMVSTVVIVPQDSVEAHIELVGKAAKGDSVEASRTREDCETTKQIMGNRHKMYRASYAFYVRGRSLRELNQFTNEARAVLLRYGYRAIAPQDDVRALDRWLLNLPMNYNPNHDRAEKWRNTQLMWVEHIANMSPLMGRSIGTGHPGICQFNRGGEPLVFDPLHKADRVKNAHMMLIGPTGAGKSASLVGILSHVMAVHRPRLFIIEAGNSFGLLAQWFRTQGITVTEASMKPGAAPPLPTFADAALLLNQTSPQTDDADLLEADQDVEDEEDAERDILGEMEIIATLMITGGEEREAALLRRADRRVIRDAILLGARRAAEREEVVLTMHVREAFYEIAQDEIRPTEARQRIREMGDAIGLFCDGFSGSVFNRAGQVWPEADVTLIDLAYFAREGYEAHLAIAVISLLNTINHLAERDQHNAREIIVTIDEAHVITTNPLLSPYLVKIVKMWRKLGAWLWLATQNLDDFPGSAKKLLNMIEWWVCLVMPKEEVEQIQRFKQLTGEQMEMLRSASKADRQYTEGVVLAKNLDVLFRAVPPSLILALAMTEKHEKSERLGLMEAHGIDEVEAARRIAASIDVARGLAS